MESQAVKQNRNAFIHVKETERAICIDGVSKEHMKAPQESQRYTPAKSNISIIEWELCFCYLLFPSLPGPAGVGMGVEN